MVARWHPIQLLGDASYSIYLTHLFVTRAFAKVPMRIDLRAHPAAAVLAAGVALALVGLVGVGVHWWVERPLSKLAHQLWPARQAHGRA